MKWAKASGEPVFLSQPSQGMPTLKEYIPEWLETHAKVHCKPSTYRGYKRAIEQHLIPTFRDRPLHLLKRDEVKRFIVTQIEAVKARGTIQNYLVPLKPLLIKPKRTAWW